MNVPVLIHRENPRPVVRHLRVTTAQYTSAGVPESCTTSRVMHHQSQRRKSVEYEPATVASTAKSTSHTNNTSQPIAPLSPSHIIYFMEWHLPATPYFKLLLHLDLKLPSGCKGNSSSNSSPFTCSRAAAQFVISLLLRGSVK